MTSIDIDINNDLDIFSGAVITREWQKVLKMYKEKKELRTANIPYGDKQGTSLHWAMRWEKEHVVESMVDIVMNEEHHDNNGDDKNVVLGAQDENGDTPLHIAAGYGSVKICDKISKADPLLLIAKRNNAGETPLFLVVLYGKKEAFLSLHYQYMSSGGDIAQCIKRDNQDTILHCALEHKHIDLAKEIVLLYKGHLTEIMGMGNRNGLSPLHLLAETPSFFQSTDLAEQSFIVRRLLYPLTKFVGVKKKATTRDELEHDANKKSLRNLVDSIRDFFVVVYPHDWWSWAVYIVACFLFYLLVMIPLGLPLIAEYWFHKMRYMKKKHTWSIQIIQELLQHASVTDMSANPYKEEEDNGSKIIDTPLMVATKNGVTEVVDKILKYCPYTTEIVNEEGKNIVLLAAEKRQTKVYKMLYEYRTSIESEFSQVDKEGNTALHLAINPNWKTTTLDEEIQWFEFVKKSVPDELKEKPNKAGKSAEEIFRHNYEKQMKNERQWLNQSSQACSVVSSVVASVAFSNLTSNSDPKTHIPSLVALFMSLTSTTILLAILSARSQSLNFWKRVSFMLQTAIFLMISSIVSLWISLMLRHNKYLITYISLVSIFGILSIVLTIVVIGPAIKSMITKVPPPNRITSPSATRYRKKAEPTPTSNNDSLQDIVTSLKNFMLTNVPPPNHSTGLSVIGDPTNARPTPTSNDSLQDNGSSLSPSKD